MHLACGSVVTTIDDPPARRRTGSCLRWVLALIVILIILAILF
jgi:hypothetical protein